MELEMQKPAGMLTSQAIEALPQSKAQGRHYYPVEFDGKGTEFFGIWIVNLLLTILTLGIYSAWAKVRKNRYFYGNTYLDDIGFEYLAEPMQILKGRMIAVLALAVYYGISYIDAAAGIAVLVVGVCLLPAVIVMSLAFRMRHTAYRNVPFHFQRNFKQAYKLFSLPLLVSVSVIAVASVYGPQVGPDGQPVDADASTIMIGLLPFVLLLGFPWWECIYARFKVQNTGCGESRFNSDFTVGSFYMIYFVAFGMFIAAGVLVAIVGIQSGSPDGSAGGKGLAALLVPLFFFVGYLLMFAYIQTRKFVIILNGMKLSEHHRLICGLKTSTMVWIYVTNTIGILCTLGLLIPWAMVRTAKARLESIRLQADAPLDGYMARAEQKWASVGEELGEAFDLEIGI